MVARSKLGRSWTGYVGLTCPRCSGALRHETLQDGPQSCGSCKGKFEAVRFDPVRTVLVVPSLAEAGPDGGAPCAQHAGNQAEASCARCGQFMCALCRIDAEGKPYCPPCYERLMQEGSVPGGATRLKNWAGFAAICLLVSWIPPILFLGPIPGGLAFFFCILAIRDKKSRRERDGLGWVYVLMLFCLLAMAVGTGILIGMFKGFAQAGAH